MYLTDDEMEIELSKKENVLNEASVHWWSTNTSLNMQTYPLSCPNLRLKEKEEKESKLIQ